MPPNCDARNRLLNIVKWPDIQVAHSHKTNVSTMQMSAQRLLFHGDDGVFYHSFSCPASFDDETTVLSVCEGSIPSSIALLKEGQVLRSGPHNTSRHCFASTSHTLNSNEGAPWLMCPI